MRDGFVKVAAATLNTKVADVEHNKWEIFRLIDETIENGAKIVVFPELCITGYTCGDLFSQDILLSQSAKALEEIAAYTTGKDGLFLSVSHMSCAISCIMLRQQYVMVK